LNQEPYSVVSLFHDLSQRQNIYAYPELRRSVQELLREHSRAFPPSYTVNEAIEWALRNDCLAVQEGQVEVRFPFDAEQQTGVG